MAAGVVLAGTDDNAFLLNASLSTFVGQGTFVQGEGGNSSVVSQLTLSPSYRIGRISLFARQTVSWEWTDPDNPSGRQFDALDTSLGILVPFSIKTIDTRVQLVSGIRLPVSYASRAQGLYGGLFVGATAVYRTPLKGLQLVLGLAGQVNGSAESLRADGADSTFDDRTLGPINVTSCYARAGEDQAAACGAIPSIAQLSGRLALTYLVGDFSFVIGLSVISQIQGDLGPDDELTAEAARTGVNATTFTSGTVSANYVATRWLIIGLGISSFQPIQTADGQGVRFPFWNFSGENNNFSSIFLATSFIY